jgi:hypothetical protein
MTPVKKATASILTAAASGRISRALGPQLAAHLASSHPQGIALGEASSAHNPRGRKSRFVASAIVPVYVAQLHQLARSGVARLQPAGLLLLVRSPALEHLLVEVSDPTQSPAQIRVTSGPTVQTFERALTASTLRPVQKRSSLRVLRVPALHLSALWRDDPSNLLGTTFVPFTANTGGFKPGQRYTLRSFDAKLKHAALQCILRWYEQCIAKEKASKADITLAPRRSQTSTKKPSGNR